MNPLTEVAEIPCDPHGPEARVTGAQRVVRLAPAILAIALYAVTLYGTYVYDDLFIVQQDPRVRQVAHWKQLWTTDYFNGAADNLYRPLVSTSYAIEWFIHGDQPWYFHAVNILLHALVCMAVAEFTRRCMVACGGSRANITGLFAGLLFAAHPIHVEAVANIVGRAELACALAIFAGLVILARRPLTQARAAMAIGSAFIALLCKEHGLLVPLVWSFLLVLIWPKPGNAIATTGERSALKALVLVMSWAWAAYIIGREHFLKFEWDRTFLDPVMQPMIHSHGMDRLLLPIVLLGRYTRLTFWPSGLSVDYGADVIGSTVHLGDAYLYIGAVALIGGVAALIWASLARHRFVLFCLLSMGVMYGVIGNILKLIGTIFAERIAYIPSAFLIILVAMGITRLPKAIGISLMIVLLGLCSVRTVISARQWNDPLALYQESTANCPKSLQLHFLLAQSYHDKADEAHAQSVMREATEMYPNYWQAWMQRAMHAMDSGQLDDAARFLANAKRINVDPHLLPVQERLSRMIAARNSGRRNERSSTNRSAPAAGTLPEAR